MMNNPVIVGLLSSLYSDKWDLERQIEENKALKEAEELEKEKEQQREAEHRKYAPVVYNNNKWQIDR